MIYRYTVIQLYSYTDIQIYRNTEIQKYKYVALLRLVCAYISITHLGLSQTCHNTRCSNILTFRANILSATAPARSKSKKRAGLSGWIIDPP